MTSSQETAVEPHHVPVRRKIACQTCNARRVRCDASEGRPCTNCRARGVSCELMKRKKKSRYKAASHRLELSPPPQHPDQQIDLDPIISEPSAQYQPQPIISSGALDSHQLIKQTERTPLPLSHDDEPASIGINKGLQKDGSETLYAKLAELNESPQGSTYHNSSHSIYLNAPSSLMDIVHQGNSEMSRRPLHASGPARMHFALPESMGGRARNIPYETHDAPFKDDEDRLLHKKGVFMILDSDAHEELIRAYFQWFHPAFPIINRQDFLQRLGTNQLSPLLLQAVYFIGATHCGSDIMAASGFSNRDTARLTFYKRAKALYDVDYESDPVTIVQSLFLMSFWWGGPLDQKDTWHWLGAAISLAQTKGMHRSTQQSTMLPKDRKLWKRIWWSLYIRDRHTAASLGRPMRVDDRQCDVEMLVEDDFKENLPHDNTICGTTEIFHVHYFCEMAKLAILLGKILIIKFAAKISATAAAEFSAVVAEMDVWNAGVPMDMRYQGLDGGIQPAFWANNLQVAYNYHLILLHRPMPVNNVVPHDSKSDDLVTIAAGKITRMVEDLLPTGLIHCAQLHFVPSIFVALCVHLGNIRRSSNLEQHLADQRARLCMLSLKELQQSWPVGGWILHLFTSIFDKLSKQDKGFKPSAYMPLEKAQNGSSFRSEFHKTGLSGNPSSAATFMASEDIGFSLGSNDPLGLSQEGSDFQLQAQNYGLGPGAMTDTIDFLQDTFSYEFLSQFADWGGASTDIS